jgi:hypothetical protein
MTSPNYSSSHIRVGASVDLFHKMSFMERTSPRARGDRRSSRKLPVVTQPQLSAVEPIQSGLANLFN